jgi:hypothetical protein
LYHTREFLEFSKKNPYEVSVKDMGSIYESEFGYIEVGLKWIYFINQASLIKE